MKFKGRLERGKLGAVRILNGTVSATDRVLEYEMDQGHVGIMVSDFGLTPECKGVVTLGVSEKEEKKGEELGEVDKR